jgi:glyoxylase-like metal-dependent hydrolase (beta-lactamase superfamily II)
MIRLRYGNTNTFLVKGLLIDSDYAGPLPAFYHAIRQAAVKVSDIHYVLATHYHPDHCGLIPELMRQGVKLLLIDRQIAYVHYADSIFARDGLPFDPIDPTDPAKAATISLKESRSFLAGIGINGEIISTPSHSPDSVSLILDSGACFVGDLEPIAYLDAYEENDPHKAALKEDWRRVLSFHPGHVFYAHANDVLLQTEACRI